jgi:hypothetical protein
MTERELAIIGASLVDMGASMRTAAEGAQKVVGGGVILNRKGMEETATTLSELGSRIIKSLPDREMKFEEEPHASPTDDRHPVR